MDRAKKSNRLKASGILEVIVAMVIIVMIFGIAMMIFGNVTRSSLTFKKLRFQAVLQQEMIRAEQGKSYSDSVYTTDGLQISRRFEPCKDNIKLMQISLTVIDDAKDSVATIKKIFIK